MRRRKKKVDRRGGSTLTLVLLMGSMVLPTVTGFTGAATTMTRRWVAKTGPDCELVRLVEADSARIHCFGEGFALVRIVGFDAPSLFEPECLDALIDGYHARWDMQVALWRARQVQMVMVPNEGPGLRQVQLFLDGDDVAKRMIMLRHSTDSVFGTPIRRCKDYGRR